MITIRVTAKVAKRLKVPLDPSPQASTGSLGDWYVNYLIIRRQHLLLAVSEQTLLPVVMPARDLALFPMRLSHDLEALLGSLRIPEEKTRAETSEMNRWCFAKTASRQVLGSMNDFAHMLEAFMDDGAPLLKQALRLGQSPCSPLGMDNPIRATGNLFGIQVPRRAFDSAFSSLTLVK